MNNGKVCVSVCAETADELIEQIERAERLADVIEIRFDCLKKEEFEKLNYSFPHKENYIYTFRPKEQGGKRELSLKEREDFWNSGNDFCGGDFEEDVVENHLSWLYQPVICSYHDFNRVSEHLVEIYERIKNANANIDAIKIAVQANDITNTIPIWKLLERWIAEKETIKAKKLREIEELEKKINSSFPRPISFLQIIPIAMGEAGKWTRILSLAHGAFMTYAALEDGGGTAPGQISVKDLIETYRVKELNEQTAIYGIVGNPVAHSLSPFIHNAAFKFHNLNAVYIPFEVRNLDEFIAKFIREETREIELNFKGFSVTIPHKQAIIKHLDSIDDTAKKIGAVNTVKIVDGKLYGYNTDAEGFIEPLLNAYGNLKNVEVAVLGAGGAARAAIYALKKESAKVAVFARNVENARKLAEEFEIEFAALGNRQKALGTCDIIVNATSLGTKGEAENDTPASAEQLKTAHLVYDLIYNPFETKFLREAKSVGVPTIGGLAMLITQAMAQFKIWTELDAPMKEMNRAALRKLQP
jgi:3-dehydroquinate dehydratase/shikimate dehydrogenase